VSTREPSVKNEIKNGENNSAAKNYFGKAIPQEVILDLLDGKNRQILALLAKNPSISQTEIANTIGLSQSSVAIRIQSLTRYGLLKTKSGVDYQKLGLLMGGISVHCTDTEKLLTWAKSCPLFVFGFHSIGNGIALYFVAEDLDTMQSIIDNHVRRIDGVSTLGFSSIGSWTKGDEYTLPLDLRTGRSEIPPCGMLPYCRKCPANPNYDGRIWSDGNTMKD
jgi:DNA-binding Lrp family transcriptional regulator